MNGKSENIIKLLNSQLLGTMLHRCSDQLLKMRDGWSIIESYLKRVMQFRRMIKMSKMIDRNIMIIDYCLRLANKPHHLIPLYLDSFALLVRLVEEKADNMRRR